MVDQAERLRTLISGKRESVMEFKKTMRVIAVTSGKGGVGKTNFALNLAIFFAKSKSRVVLIDADFGLANVELLLGISPRYSFKDVLSGEATITEALTAGPEGMRFLSGGSGLTQLADVAEAQIALLLDGFNKLGEMTDVLIIDTGAGISKSVTNFLKASHEAIVVTTSDPTAITDAYAVMKAIAEHTDEPPQLKIVLNRVESQREGTEVFERLRRVCTRFLNMKPQYLGSIPYDKHLVRAVKSQEPVVLMYPTAESSRSIEMIGRRLLNEPDLPQSGIKSFVSRWIGIMRS